VSSVNWLAVVLGALCVVLILRLKMNILWVLAISASLSVAASLWL
jgi:hypothetical protein